ncbi:MAG TPA: helix-turn-helix transcriptional regulator [Acidimicrobiales bacterium]|nr:helix-turn-helix transcriptional regulator [Acidimicrobiales bacterium]
MNGQIVPEPGAPPAWVARLSRREVAVLRLLAEGESTADIAVALAYSESTIKNVIHEMVRNLGARNRAHAVALAIRGGAI